MKKKLLFAAIVISSFALCPQLFFGEATSAQVPGWDWAKTDSCGGQQIVRRILNNATGSVVTGSFEGDSIVLGSLVLHNAYSLHQSSFIEKIDPSGNTLWARLIIGDSSVVINGLAADASGNLYICGDFYGDSVRFDGQVIFNSAPPYQENFLAKYDAFGMVVWAKSSGGQYNDDVSGIAVDANGNVLVGGGFIGGTMSFGSTTLLSPITTNSQYNLFIAKYSSVGSVLWASSAGGLIGYIFDDAFGINSITTDYDGNAYCSGYFMDSVVFSGAFEVYNSAPNTSNFEAFVAKYNAVGNLIWTKGIHNGLGDDVSIDDMEYGAIQGLIICGSTTASPLYIAGQSVTLTMGTGGYNGFIAKLDTSGNALWGSGTNGGFDSYYYDVSLNNLGDIYVGGKFDNSSIMVGSTSLSNAGNSDVLLAKYNSIGNVAWATSFGGTGIEWLGRLSVDPSDNVLVAGMFNHSGFNIGPNPIPTQSCTSFNFFLAKLGSNCSAAFIIQPDTIPHTWIATNFALGISPITYTWDWDDGSPTSSGPTPSHIYSTPGYYNICLTITDSTGCTSTYCDSSTYI